MKDRGHHQDNILRDALKLEEDGLATYLDSLFAQTRPCYTIPPEEES